MEGNLTSAHADAIIARVAEAIEEHISGGSKADYKLAALQAINAVTDQLLALEFAGAVNQAETLTRLRGVN